MSDLDRYFSGPREKELHPKARRWRRRFQNGDADSATCEVWRKREGLSFTPTKLYVTFFKIGQEVGTDVDDWDPGLNEELVSLHVRAISKKNESVRLGLMMRTWFSIPEATFGDGFFNSVLIHYLNHSGFSNRPPVQKVLKYIHENPPEKQGLFYSECVEEIETILAAAARSLVDDLRYKRIEAEDILSEALGNYLDERFSITNRKMLGFG